MPVRRGIYYTEDSMDNWRLAKCHTKSKKTRWSHKHLYTGGFSLVKPEEVLEKLQEMGIKRDKRTLQRYAKMELVPKPEIINLGRGAGKISDYPESTPYEFYASICLKNLSGYTSEQIKEARKHVKSFEEEISSNENLVEQSHKFFGRITLTRDLQDRIRKKTNNFVIPILAGYWWYYSRPQDKMIKDADDQLEYDDKDHKTIF